MDAQSIKEFIYTNDLIETVLLAINCHHVRNHGDYYTCGNPDGDNTSSITVYRNDNINVVNYTRDITNGKRGADIFDLICYCENCSFIKSLQFVCDLFSIDYYSEPEGKPESLEILSLIKSMSSGDEECDDAPLTPIDKSILEYYLPYGNKMFEDDGISLDTQYKFNVMYDDFSNRIIIPLYDSLNNLVGIKGRLMKRELEDWEQKYLYMTNGFNKSRYVYGLNETYELIKAQGYCIVFEAEKSVMLAYEHGVSSVAILGCQMSKCQIEILTRLDVPLILALDKDRTLEEIKSECNKFLPQVSLWYMYDKDNILSDKSSPIDNWEKFQLLKKNNIYRFKKEN